MIQKAVQLPGIFKLGVDRFLIRVWLHKFGIIRSWIFINGGIRTGICKGKNIFLGNTYQFHILAVHTPQII